MGNVPLWLSAARLEEEAGNVPKARALLEQGRLKNPKIDVSVLVGGLPEAVHRPLGLPHAASGLAV